MKIETSKFGRSRVLFGEGDVIHDFTWEDRSLSRARSRWRAAALVTWGLIVFALGASAGYLRGDAVGRSELGMVKMELASVTREVTCWRTGQIKHIAEVQRCLE